MSKPHPASDPSFSALSAYLVAIGGLTVEALRAEAALVGITVEKVNQRKGKPTRADLLLALIAHYVTGCEPELHA